MIIRGGGASIDFAFRPILQRSSDPCVILSENLYHLIMKPLPS